MTDFTVSPPDLTGFSDQIAGIGDFYSSVGGQAAELSVGLSTVPVPMGTNGQLSGVLALFVDDFLALVGAERDAATRLAGGLGETARTLAETALTYRDQDDAAKRRIEEAGDSSEEDQAVDDAIEEGEPNVDWRARLSADDIFTGIDFTLPKMTYEGQFGELNGSLAALGSVPISVDLLVETVFGFSILKTLTTPLLGNWGFLWVMRDICAAEASAFETASTALDTGVGTLTADSWTGQAATAFAGHIEATRVPIDAQVANLRTASTLFDEMANTIDKAGNALALLIADLISLALNTVLPAVKGFWKNVDEMLSVLSSGAAAANAYTDVWATIKRMLGPLVARIITAVEGLVHALDAASSSTKGLCEELNALTPPDLPAEAPGGMAPAEPEGLTEEPVEPEGLTEEPNDAEPAAGSQQNR